MNVFILSTGRCGSMTFARACAEITNFTSAHESRSRTYGDERFAYPDRHIESDNRLSWFLGDLERLYGDRAFYVHLIRNKEEVCASYRRRWSYHSSIIRAFCHGIVMFNPAYMTPEIQDRMIGFYYDTVNTNIRHFLKDKSRQMTIHLEQVNEQFPEFWKAIDAEGDLQAALAVLQMRHNATPHEEMDSKSREKGGFLRRLIKF